MLFNREGPYRRLYDALPERQRRRFALVLVLMLLGGLAELVTIGSLSPFLAVLGGSELRAWPLAAELLDAVAGADRGARLAVAASAFAAAAIAAAITRLALLWSTERLAFDAGHHLVVEVHRRVLHQPYAWHVGQHSSQFIASLGKVELLTSGLLLQLLQALASLVIAGFILAALLLAAPVAALVAIAAFAGLYWLVGRVTQQRLQRNSAAVASAADRRIRLIQEYLGAIRDIILDGAQGACLAEFERVNRRLADSQAATAFVAAAPRFVIEAAGLVALALLTMLLVDADQGLAFALPMLGVIALGAQRMLPLLQQLYRARAYVTARRDIAGQVADLVALPLPATAGGPPVPLPFERAIECAGLTFTYPGRDRPAIDDVTLTIEQGARIALIGATGAGKSTLADLLMGLIEPDSGSIAVDGKALDSSSRAAWFRSIAHVPQSAFLADDSIARNIAFALGDQPIDMERVRHAARVAQLDSVVATLPAGYDTRVGERGVQLSGGQRQRLALARAIYKRAPVLVLDEATSALDDSTEAAVLDALDDLSKAGATIIVIAHRQSTTARCDRVVELVDGRIVAG